MKKILLLFIVSISSNHCLGQLTVTVGVKYKSTDGSYSKYYFREIDLVTGVELNNATNTREYDVYSDYALIWFDQTQVAIVKLKSKIQSDVNRMMGKPIDKTLLEINCQIAGYNKEGVDQNGTEWKLCFYSHDLQSLCS
ncbi:hypothetical protein SAMN05660226_01987 [Parapedobacter luteus]|uniref:Uncharacterized protein n=1 Tax=Parapedobacter luteus TaxID=623280 RepID=A0A1T5C948_9SPHI|nr:hypothetical protein [Parapedobacter luteus]SKB56092.1 hypothetical protein SAMN05660226_01987 [Parapedobacter luteus]